MAKQRANFVQGRRPTKRIPAAKANQIFDLLEKFAGYGFNKSHAAAYALVAYQTAYLKANYPVEFFCAMMTNDMADTEKLAEYIAEARTLDIPILPPDLLRSGANGAVSPGQSNPPAPFDLAWPPSKASEKSRFNPSWRLVGPPAFSNPCRTSVNASTPGSSTGRSWRHSSAAVPATVSAAREPGSSARSISP
jgi:hypothetical protein